MILNRLESGFESGSTLHGGREVDVGDAADRVHLPLLLVLLLLQLLLHGAAAAAASAVLLHPSRLRISPHVCASVCRRNVEKADTLQGRTVCQI